MQVLGQWAGHYNAGTSDKVWAAAYTDEGDFLYVYGRRFTRLTPKAKHFSSVGAARAWFNKKVDEQSRQGYHSIPFDSDAYRVPGFAHTSSTIGSSGLTQTPPPPRTSTGTSALPCASTSTLPIPVSPLLPVDADDLDELLDDPAYGIIEYVVGLRAVVMSDGASLAACYPDSGLASAVPEAARVLARLNVSVVLDGIQLPGGEYIVIDLLAWNGSSMERRPYRERIGIISRAFQQAGLITAGLPVRPKPMPGSTHKQLALLVARTTDKRQVVELLRRAGATGVLLRLMDEPGFNLPVHQHTFRVEAEVQA